jgi:hypothetical protein
VSGARATTNQLEPAGRQPVRLDLRRHAACLVCTMNTGMNLSLPPALGGTVSTDASVGFGQLLSHLNFGAVVAADARYDKTTIFTDFLYVNLGGVGTQIRSVNFPNHPNIPISTTVQASVDMNLSAPIWTLAGGYTVARGDWGNFDAIVGFRYLELNARVNYSLALTLTGPRGNGATFGGSVAPPVVPTSGTGSAAFAAESASAIPRCSSPIVSTLVRADRT